MAHMARERRSRVDRSQTHTRFALLGVGLEGCAMTRRATQKHTTTVGHMTKIFAAASVGGLFAATALTAAAGAQASWDVGSQQRYDACVAKVATDAETAFEDALIFRDEGGGVLARHCIALALLELGRTEEAASRLEEAAFMPDGGDADMRAEMLSQAGNAWLIAHAPVEAENAFTNALLIKPGDADIFIDRARALALQERFVEAVSDLSVALAQRPNDVLALRLRADAHLELGQIDQAEQDVADALAVDPRDIDALVVRGRVREARRLAGR